ncbi:hypothetical protein [Amycolatopsis minnesotensis]|uniref:Centromere-binding protein ParB C-terminal domain-containing protein n=1 Tax=Amycolatopsis minnesotensis TaxID=337894 RepID=A0ABN2SAF2_9PSEU
MAGHVRTMPGTGRQPGVTGRSRKVRVHLPPGEAEVAKRVKQRNGARTIAQHRIVSARTPQARLDAARDYVRSAAAKYRADDEIAVAVEALLAAGDRIFARGAPVDPGTRAARQVRAARNRERARTNQVLIREGRKSVRRQQMEARESA